MRNHVRVNVVSSVRHQQFFKVITDLSFAFHAQIRLGPAGVAAKLRRCRALKHRNFRSDVCRGHGGRETCDAAADDENVKLKVRRRIRFHRYVPAQYLRMKGSGISRSLEIQTLLTSRNSFTASTPPSRP